MKTTTDTETDTEPRSNPVVMTPATPLVPVREDSSSGNHILESDTASNTATTTTSVSSLSSSSTTTTTPSAHLQLTDPTLRPVSETKNTPLIEDGSDQNDTTTGRPPTTAATTTTQTLKPSFGTTTVTVHTYHDTTTNQTYKSLNISRRKFRSYLQYCAVWNNHTASNTTTTTTTNMRRNTTTTTTVDDYTGIETVRSLILSTSSKTQLTVETDDDTSPDDSLSTSGNNSHAPNNVVGNNNNKEQLRNVTRQLRDEWRALWRSGRLITDRTELLAVYPSDDHDDDAVVVVQRDMTTTTTPNDEKVNNNHNHQEHTSKPVLRKRGGFADLLFLYTDRLMAILSDEHDDSNHANESTGQKTMDIVTWLEHNYGRSETHDLQYENFQLWDESTKLIKLKHFLEWFRSQFPYFYDRCDSCGASMKEDLAKAAATNAASDPSTTSTSTETTMTSGATNETDHPLVLDNGDNATVDDAVPVVHTEESSTPEEVVNTSDAADTESEHQTFVGYVYPNRTELVGKASRTELYQCHECASFTRFPRYNAAQFVMSQKRGRCGEYSMLLYRFIRALHHECRWVVDWADHVWVEVLLLDNNNTSITNPSRSRWIHLDPCEAAVNENYIYQGWGKKQNYIVGLYLPTILNMNASLQHLSDHQVDVMNNRTLTTSTNISYIEDITHSYTNEEWSDICHRRDESETHVQASIVKATQELQNKLLEYYNFTTTTAATSNATNNN